MAGMRIHSKSFFGPKQKQAWRDAYTQRHRECGEPLRNITVSKTGDINWQLSSIYLLEPAPPNGVDPKTHMYTKLSAFGKSIDIFEDRVSGEWTILDNWGVVAARLQGVGRLAGTTQCLSLFPGVVQQEAVAQMFTLGEDEAEGEEDNEEDDEENYDDDDEDEPAGPNDKTTTPAKKRTTGGANSDRKRFKVKTTCERSGGSAERGDATSQQPPATSDATGSTSAKVASLPGVAEAVADPNWVANAISKMSS